MTSGKRKTRFNMVVNAQGRGLSSKSGMARESTSEGTVVFPDCVPGGTTVEAGESIVGGGFLK